MRKHSPSPRVAINRERTLTDMVEAGLALTREGRPVSLRRVGERIGLSGPGLYRYVDSLAELTALVAAALLAELDAEARERVGGSYEKWRVVARATVLIEWQQHRRLEWSLLCGPGGPCAPLITRALELLAAGAEPEPEDIGCDNGIHLPGCPYAHTDQTTETPA